LNMVYARMAELADAPDSKSGSRKRVGVQPSLWAPYYSCSSTGVVSVFITGTILL